MTGFTGRHPKCYDLKIHCDDEEEKTCKGTAKNTVKRTITYDDFNQALETKRLYVGHLTVLTKRLRC